METLLRLLCAIAFVAGGVGLVAWIGSHDRGVSWYPFPSATTTTPLLVLAASAAGLAFVVWVFLVTT